MNKVLILCLLFVFSCGDDVMPKPEAELRLDYPEAKYRFNNLQDPNIGFELNVLADTVKVKPLGGGKLGHGITVNYPSLKGTLYLTYKPVKGKEVLIQYLKDAQNFTQEHTRIADEITEQVYNDKKQRVFGMLYEVGGNAASQSQFYVTDSTKHFLTGSLYFYAKPNYDSILPAAEYLKKDIRKLVETLNWK